MKSFQFLLAAGLLSFSAASAQTAPNPAMPTAPAPKGTASASQPVSGMAAPAPDPKGAVSSEEVFTKGDPNGNRMRNRDMEKRRKMKTSMDGSGKVKTKM